MTNLIRPQDLSRRISLSLFCDKGVLMQNPYNPKDDSSWICVGKGFIVYGATYCEAWDKWEEATKPKSIFNMEYL